jgi:Lrp/AsnC family leucine-responsive transcriptional regulator
MRMDRVNVALLELLQRNGRMNFADMAREVKRGESTVRERVAALEARGIIKGYRAVIDRTKLGYKVHALVRAEVPLNVLSKVTERLGEVPNVVRAQLTTDPRPLVVEVGATSLEDFGRIMEQRLASIGLSGMEVAMVIQNLIEDRCLPVANGEPGPDGTIGGMTPIVRRPRFDGELTG